MYDRREFLKTIQAMGVASVVPALLPRLASGSQDVNDTTAAPSPPFDLSGDELLQALDASARESLGPAGNCAQTSFAILQKQFDLPGEAIHRGLSTFPGIGFTGNTCGAVVGSLVALNLVFGYEAGDEAATRKTAYVKAQELVQRFEEDRGTTTCAGIHEAATGRWHNLMDPEDARAFGEAGGGKACRTAVATGVRIAAELILAERDGAAAAS
jgi:C_GCAxxG_C_C family probable redox protein